MSAAGHMGRPAEASGSSSGSSAASALLCCWLPESASPGGTPVAGLAAAPLALVVGARLPLL